MSFELYAIKSPPCVGHVRPESLPVSHAAHILKTLNQTTSRTPEYDSRYKVSLSLVIYLPNRFRCQTSKSPTLADAHPEVDEPGRTRPEDRVRPCPKIDARENSGRPSSSRLSSLAAKTGIWWS